MTLFCMNRICNLRLNPIGTTQTDSGACFGEFAVDQQRNISGLESTGQSGEGQNCMTAAVGAVQGQEGTRIVAKAATNS